MSIGKKRAPRFRVGETVKFLYGTDKVAGEILEDRGPLGDYGRRLYRVRSTRDRKTSHLSRSRKKILRAVTHKTPQSNHLDCGRNSISSISESRRRTSGPRRQKRGQLYSGVKAKGAVGYTTGRWEGEREGDENHAIVTVLVECNQTMCDSQSRVRPTAWPEMTATAREHADRMFKTRYQDAVIEHQSIVS